VCSGNHRGRRDTLTLKIFQRAIWLPRIVVFCGLASAPWMAHAQTTLRAAMESPLAPASAQPIAADLPDAPEPNLPQAPATGASQGQTDQQKQTDERKPESQQPGSAPSLGDLGFTPEQTQANAKMQAMLDKRTHMLKIHQRLGLITTLPMAAALITGPMAKAKGRNGQTITEPTQANLDFHAALGGATSVLYGATAYYAIFAPKVPGSKRRGAIRLHRALAFVHGPGMIATPILGAMAFKQEQAGERVHGIASAHGTVAWCTVAAYGAAMVSVSWPLKFHR
jgi:hypothetical protein